MKNRKLISKICASLTLLVLFTSCGEKKLNLGVYSNEDYRSTAVMEKHYKYAMENYIPIEKNQITAAIINDDSIDAALAKVLTGEDATDTANLRNKYKEKFHEMEGLISDYYGLKLVDRSRINQIKAEHKFQTSDFSNSAKTAELGRALNADALIEISVTVTKEKYLTMDGYSYNANSSASFININTMQKKVLNSGDFLSQNANFIEYLPEKPSVLYFDCGKKSTKKFNTNDSVCPFVNNALFKLSGKKDFAGLEDVASMTFDYDSKTCLVEFESGDMDVYKLRYKKAADEDFKILFSSHHDRYHLPYNFNKYVTVKELGQGNSIGWMPIYVLFNTGKIAEIRISGDEFSISGNLYRNGDSYAIDLGSEKDDGSGEHYYAFFTDQE